MILRLAACTVAVLAAAPAAPGTRASREVARIAYLMGTRATLVTWDTDPERATARLERLLTALERTEAELSTWRRDSAISRLNAAPHGGTVPLAPPLCALFRELDRWTRETAGAFDPAVGALAEAWGLHDRPRVPGADDLRAARARSGWARLGFDPTGCTVHRRAGVALDVGAFGKGEALDRAAAAAGGDVRPWLIDLGGQVAVHGVPPSGSWRIAVAHPHDRERPLFHIDVTSGGLATSGGSERDATARGRRVGHILDPRTGFPAAFTGSVTVWHQVALAADILSTALYVMGPADGLAWAEQHGIAACFLLPETDGDTVQLEQTSAFRQRFSTAPARP